MRGTAGRLTFSLRTDTAQNDDDDDGGGNNNNYY